MGYPGVSYFSLVRKRFRERYLKRNKRTQRIDSAVLLAFAQFVVISLLLSVISVEYQSNRYMQEWIKKNAWPIGYLLNGYLAATLIGFAIGGAFLVLQRWRSSGESRIDRDRL